MTIRKTISIAVLAGVVGMLGLTACGTGSESAAPEQITRLDGYELASDPVSAVSYPGNALVVEAVVSRSDAPRKVSIVKPDGSKLAYIYTPVVVDISRVYKGTGVSVGQQLVVRALGGAIGAERTVSELGPAPGSYKPGQRLVLLTQERVNAGDGLLAATPNFVFELGSSGRTVNLHEADAAIATTDLRALLDKQFPAAARK